MNMLLLGARGVTISSLNVITIAVIRDLWGSVAHTSLVSDVSNPLPSVNRALLSRPSLFNHLQYGGLASTTLQNDWGGFEVQTNPQSATITATATRWPQNTHDVSESRAMGWKDMGAYRMGDFWDANFSAGGQSVNSKHLGMDLMDVEIGGHMGWKETFDKVLSNNAQKIMKHGEGQTTPFVLNTLFDMPTSSFVDPAIALDEGSFDFDELSIVDAGVYHDVQDVLCYDVVLQSNTEASSSASSSTTSQSSPTPSAVDQQLSSPSPSTVAQQQQSTLQFTTSTITHPQNHPSDPTHRQRDFTCGINHCRRSYKRRYELQRHQRTHFGLRPHTCSFQGCARGGQNGFARKDHLMQHVRQVHRV